MRPLGVALTFIQVDFADEGRGPQIFKCDPAGYFTGVKASGHWSKTTRSNDLFREKIQKPMLLKEIGKNC